MLHALVTSVDSLALSVEPPLFCRWRFTSCRHRLRGGAKLYLCWKVEWVCWRTVLPRRCVSIRLVCSWRVPWCVSHTAAFLNTRAFAVYLRRFMNAVGGAGVAGTAGGVGRASRSALRGGSFSHLPAAIALLSTSATAFCMTFLARSFPGRHRLRALRAYLFRGIAAFRSYRTTRLGGGRAAGGQCASWNDDYRLARTGK